MPSTTSGFSGGKAKTVFIPIDSAHSALRTYANGADSATVPTTEAGGFVLKKLGNGVVISSDIAIADDNIVTLTIPTTRFDADSYKFLKYAKPLTPAAASVEMEKITDEDGNTIGGTSAGSGKQFLALTYGKSNGSEIYVFAAIVSLTNWGGTKQESGKWVQPQYKFTSTPCLNASGLSIPATMFDSTIVTVSTAQTLPYNAYGEYFFLTPAA